MFNDQDLCLEVGKYFVDTKYRNSPIYRETLDMDGTLWNGNVSSKELSSNLSNGERGVISLSRNIISTESLKQVGVIAMAIRKELLLDVISPIELEKESGIVVLDENNEIILSRENEGAMPDRVFTREGLGSIERAIASNSQGHITLDNEKEKFLINYGLIPENDWKVISFMPYSHIMEQTEGI